ncbi:MAG: hypothetical protein K8S18_17485 [Desulfobacula sp.]|nr:hypothetical protein [Desulfobacula sp.]
MSTAILIVRLPLLNNAYFGNPLSNIDYYSELTRANLIKASNIFFPRLQFGPEKLMESPILKVFCSALADETTIIRAINKIMNLH